MSTRSTRKQAENPMRIAAPVANPIMDTGAKDLLGALVTFLQPLILGQAFTMANNQNLDVRSAKVINGSEGKNLVSALTAFVKVVINSTPEVGGKQGDSLKLGPGADKDRINDVPPDLPKEVARSELETMVLTAARAHVFNKMPIRLLAFDKDGSNIRLIERNEIFSTILPSVLANIKNPEFQAEWAAAKTLEDGEWKELTHMQYRQNKMRELTQDIVEESVKYGILSHTWMRDEPGEVTFQDWATRDDNPRGNTKIARFCKATAENHNSTLGWIDTVCIDKSSSSELEESIRSMYNWYRRASICATYLSETVDLSDAPHDSWFTCGWTLQELAPTYSIFYNQNWEQMGSNSDAKIQSVIKMASGISCKELAWSWQGLIEEIPLSRRLQMACSRQVTREEDTSYSLMGILNVDIPIAYGEGASRAFHRLIRELFNTKRNVMDLFNRSYIWGEGLLPSSLELYQYRWNFWDNSNFSGGTYLDQYPPLDSIIPTHLGMRIPLLLAPILLTHIGADGNYAAKGALSAMLSILVFNFRAGEMATGNKFHFLLCDSRLYVGRLTNLRSPALPHGINHIRMAGIINFGIDTSHHILLPLDAFALRLHWSGLEEGSFTPSGSVFIYPGHPNHFKLESKIGYRIPLTELGKHGVQLVTMHL